MPVAIGSLPVGVEALPYPSRSWRAARPRLQPRSLRDLLDIHGVIVHKTDFLPNRQESWTKLAMAGWIRIYVD